MNNQEHPKKFSKKKHFFSIITSRVFIICLLIALQLGFLFGTVVYMGMAWYWLYFLLNLISFGVVLWIVSKRDNPTYKIAWIILIMAIPLIGGLFYLMFGNKHVSHPMQKQIDEYTTMMNHRDLSGDQLQRSYIEQLRTWSPTQARQAEYIYNMTGYPVLSNTQATYLPSGERYFQCLLEELPKAERFIFLEYFIIQEGEMWNPILAILEDRIHHGVEVRVLYDDMGCIQTLPNHYDSYLRAKGFKVGVFNPFRPRLTASTNYRDHRKICVIDGNTGFTGGINLADEYINAIELHGHWKDTGVMLRGEGVRNLTEMFLQLWQFTCKEDSPLEKFLPTRFYPADGFVLPFGDSPLDTLNVAENAYMQMINHAKQYVYITTPYLILDNEMVTALQVAAQSGIDVRIMTPHVPDKWFVHPVTQSFYRLLLETGVRIYEYTPGFIHAKMFICDDETAIVGTTNMDFRSFYLHFECGVVFYDSSIIMDVKEDFLKTQRICTEITLEHENKTGAATHILRSLLRGFSPLM